MLRQGLLLSLCTAGLLQLLAPGSISVAAWSLVSSRMTFHRLKEPLSWEEAREYCRQHHTDLADLHSVDSPSSMLTMAGIMSTQEAWIGLFFDISTSGLRWSSGSTFTSLTWSSLPRLGAGMCATLYYSWTMSPALGGDSCSSQKPFICYEDPEAGRRISSESTLSLTSLPLPKRDPEAGRRISLESSLSLTSFTLPKRAEVQIGDCTFTRFEKNMTWISALKYCRNHYTDLADLQTVTEGARKKALRSVANDTEAWIGLYLNTNSGSLNWSSGSGAVIHEWMKVPAFFKGLCAGLATYARVNLQVYAVACSLLRPFICFYDPSSRHRETAEMPPISLSFSSEVATGTTPGTGTGTSAGPAGTSQSQVSAERPPRPASAEPPGLDPSTRAARASAPTGPADPPATASPRLPASPATPGTTSAPQTMLTAQTAPPDLAPLTPASRGSPSAPRDVAGTPLAPAASPTADPAPRESPAPRARLVTWREVSAGASRGSTCHVSAAPGRAGTPAPSRGSGEPALRASVPVVRNEGTTVHPPSAAPSQAALGKTAWSPPGTTTAVSSVEGGTDMRDTVTATRVQHLSSSDHSESKEKTSAGESGYSFGILKADFTISTLMDPEEMKDQFLREIQEVLKLTLGHKQFRLKWVGFEVNKK